MQARGDVMMEKEGGRSEAVLVGFPLQVGILE